MILLASLTTLLIYNFRLDRRGVTAIEYGLIASMMAVVLVVAVALLTGSLSSAFTTISGDFPIK
ncbi:Flp family type IVb pilin [Lichenicola cladoniae]|uniref:Flp family type IVb pilin n=1 Tax=Lichenicola cladoniae TaxID=1484109 RepID=A0A6M8HLZ9_9PROT|nr:Flp family type IVb pilin [Lichenicola cladoniae]NPD69971.1 Flp family type IVb pilin [Acetobacteraceae bacterium]QKE89389.1 Flp family type IVb pilin [Lichenicola cladoniae]